MQSQMFEIKDPSKEEWNDSPLRDDNDEDSKTKYNIFIFYY